MSLYEMAKDAVSIAQKADNIELIQKLLDIGNEAQILQQKVIDLSKENTKLKEHIQIKDKLKFINNTYILQTENEDDFGPYCTTCWDDRSKLIRLHKDGGRYYCPVCKRLITEVHGSGPKTVRNLQGW